MQLVLQGSKQKSTTNNCASQNLTDLDMLKISKTNVVKVEVI